MIVSPSAPLVVYRRGEREDHRGIKLAVAEWLFERRFWAVATEVPLRAGIVDVAGAAAWMAPSTAKFWCTGDVPRAGLTDMSIVVEVKATRADFLADQKTVDAEKFAFHLKRGLGRDFGAGKWQRLNGTREGSLRYIAALPGVVRRQEVPDGWGLVEWDGSRLRRIVKGRVFRDARASSGMTQAIAETWTRNALYAEAREEQREFAARVRASVREANAKRWMCLNCTNFAGPMRRPRGEHAHTGTCTVLERIVPARSHPECGWRAGESRFEPRPRAVDAVMTQSP